MRDGERDRLTQRMVDLHRELLMVLRRADLEPWIMDLTMLQLRALFTLFAGGPLPMGELASRLGVSVSTLTSIVDRLEERGLVRRVADPADRRVVRCALTPQAVDLLTRFEARGVERLRVIARDLSLDDLRRICESLDLLRDAARSGAATGPAPGAAS